MVSARDQRERWLLNCKTLGGIICRQLMHKYCQYAADLPLATDVLDTGYSDSKVQGRIRLGNHIRLY